jgi:hypothetical protein
MDAELAPVVVETSGEYIGRWNRLVSTTNWEKGRIIVAWREALRKADAPASSQTDETWARQVGGVTPQHVGRLRRVFERFGETHPQYAGLYWSHFLTALDWPDAEMWLEGAVGNKWSISQMQTQRWETLGASPELKPRDSDILAAELDEDAAATGHATASDAVFETEGEVRDAESDADYFDSGETAAIDSALPRNPPAAPFCPFENLPALPTDINEAFELFKLAIIGHKLTGWEEISLESVLRVLEGLKQLASAPAD